MAEAVVQQVADTGDLRGHKRKRSLQDTPVNLNRIRAAIGRVHVLKEELAGIEETETEVNALMEHVTALEGILRGAKKPRLSFSSFTKAEIIALGVRRGRLVFNPGTMHNLVEKTTSRAAAGVQALRTQILDIYGHVNMDYEAGSRMILDAVLLTLGKTSLNDNYAVAILPEMRIATGEGIQVRNPATGYELWLTGNVDYAVIGYKDELDNRELLLGVDNSRDDALMVAQDRFILIEAKRQNNQESLASFMPEAVSQAIAVIELTSQPQVRFCLSNGRSWIFCILTKDSSGWVYHESTARHLSQEAVEHAEGPVSEVLGLVSEWLAPIAESGLYQLARRAQPTNEMKVMMCSTYRVLHKFLQSPILNIFLHVMVFSKKGCHAASRRLMPPPTPLATISSTIMISEDLCKRIVAWHFEDQKGAPEIAALAGCSTERRSFVQALTSKPALSVAYQRQKGASVGSQV